MIPCFATHMPDIVLYGLLIALALWIGFYFVLYSVCIITTILTYFPTLIYYALKGRSKEFFYKCKHDPRFMTYDFKRRKFNW